MQQDAFQRMLGSGMGDVEVLGNIDVLRTMGDPAMAASAAMEKETTRYIDKGFRNSDMIHVGFTAITLLALTGTGNLTATVQNPFKPRDFVMPSTLCPGVFVTGIQLAGIQLLDGGNIPAEMFSEVSNYASVSWPTVQTSQQIIVGLLNTNAAAVTIGAGSRGIRVRA